MIKHNSGSGSVFSKPVFFLLFFFSLLPVSGSGFYVPCLSRGLESHQTPNDFALAPFREVEPEPLIEVVLPVTRDELLEICGHQLGMLFIILLPYLDLQFGLGAPDMARGFQKLLYGGLLLDKIYQKTGFISQATLNYLYDNLVTPFAYPEPSEHYPKSGLSTDITTIKDSTTRPFRASLYLRTENDRVPFFSEADQMIDYTNRLFKPGQRSQEMIYSQDNQAILYPSVESGEYEVFQLSVTNPDNGTHVYDIAHRNGCNWLLERDGVPLDDYLAASWTQGPVTDLAIAPVNAPARPQQRKVLLHIPRELLSYGLVKAPFALSSVINRAMQSSAPGILSKVIISTEANSGTAGNALVPAGFNRQPGIDPLWPDLALVPAELSPPSSLVSVKVPGIIQTMFQPEDSELRVAGSSSESTGDRQSVDKPRKPGRPDKSKDTPDDDDGDQRGTSPDSSSSLSSGSSSSLIEVVARDRIAFFSEQTTLHHIGQLNESFFKLLSSAGLAQVIVNENLEVSQCPLAISKTLLRFLTKFKPAEDRPHHLDSLNKMKAEGSYYVELNLELYEVMLERYEEITELAQARSKIFTGIRKKFANVVRQINRRGQGYRFVFFGGEALRTQIDALHETSYFRGNYPIRDDVDILMRMGNINMLQDLFTCVDNYAVIFPLSHSMSFQFPCRSGSCLFNVYKLELDSSWGKFLPTLDVSFPNDDSKPPVFGDQQSVLIESLSRALLFKGRLPKYIDRTIYLHHLLPDSLGAEFLYQREFKLKPLIRDKERLAQDLSLSEQQKRELLDKIETQQKEMDARLQEIQSLKQVPEKQLELVRNELELEMNAQFEERMNTLIIKNKQQVENYMAELVRLNQQQEDIAAKLKAKEGLAYTLMAEINERDALLEKLKLDHVWSQEKQTELETLLKEAHLKLAADVVVDSEELIAARDQKDALQKEVDRLKESYQKKKNTIGQLKEILQSASEKYKTQKELIDELGREKTAKSEQLLLVKSQFGQSSTQVTQLEAELAETRKQLTEKQAQLEKDKQSIINEHEQLEGRVHEMEEEGRQLREDVDWYRNERKWFMAVAMIPASLLVMREFLVPRFHDVAKATCSRFKQDITYQYCVRNWVTDESILWALEAFDELPGHTRVVRFADLKTFNPGYLLAFQAKKPNFELLNYLYQIEEMNLYLPGDFMNLGNLYISELNQSLKAFFNALSDRHSAVAVKRFANANLLLCGIMPDNNSQEKCAEALALAMKPEDRWPCNMHNLADPKDNLCERQLMPGFTRKLSKKLLLALMPSWSLSEDGKLAWYDLWPVRINKNKLSKEVSGGSCSRLIKFSKYCDRENMKIWRFADNYWNLDSHRCSKVSPIDIRGSEVFWLQSWTGEVNDIFACDDSEFMETVWRD